MVLCGGWGLSSEHGSVRGAKLRGAGAPTGGTMPFLCAFIAHLSAGRHTAPAQKHREGASIQPQLLARCTLPPASKPTAPPRPLHPLAGRQHRAALGGDARARGDCQVPADAWGGQGAAQQAGRWRSTGSGFWYGACAYVGACCTVGWTLPLRMTPALHLFKRGDYVMQG